MDLKIYCCYHKPEFVQKYNLYETEVLKPFDSTDIENGDNINHLNEFLNEFVCLYWIANNDKDSKYVGLSHYRRQFNTNEIDTDLLDDDTCYAYSVLNEKTDIDTLKNTDNGFGAEWLVNDYHEYVNGKYGEDSIYRTNTEYNVTVLFECFVMNRKRFDEMYDYLYGFLKFMDDKYDLRNSYYSYNEFLTEDKACYNKNGKLDWVYKNQYKRLIAYQIEQMISVFINIHFQYIIKNKKEYFKVLKRDCEGGGGLRIYCSFHKPEYMLEYNLYEDEILKPIDVTNTENGYNINHLNPFIREFATLFLVYVNDTESDYVGMSHYRRKFDYNNINTSILDDDTCYVITEFGAQWNGINRIADSKWFGAKWIVDDYLDYVAEKFGSDSRYYTDYDFQYKMYPYSSFVMNRKMFDKLSDYVLGFIDYIDSKYYLNYNYNRYEEFFNGSKVNLSIYSPYYNHASKNFKSLLAHTLEWLVSTFININFKEKIENNLLIDNYYHEYEFVEYPNNKLYISEKKEFIGGGGITHYYCFHLTEQIKEYNLYEDENNKLFYGKDIYNGININHLNDFINEACMIYWIYNNDITSDYICTNHYRRIIGSENIDVEMLDDDTCYVIRENKNITHSNFYFYYFNNDLLIKDYADYVILKYGENSVFYNTFFNECNFYPHECYAMNRKRFDELYDFVFGFFFYVNEKYNLRCDCERFYCFFNESYCKKNNKTHAVKRGMAYFMELLVSTFINSKFTRIIEKCKINELIY